MDATMFFDFYHVPRLLRQPLSRVGMKLFPQSLRTWPPLHDRLDWKKIYATAKDRIGQEVTTAIRSQAVILSSLAKVAGSDLAVATCRKAMEIMGEEGPIREWGIEKCFRDAKLTQIYEGTNQLNRAAMVKEVLVPGSSERFSAEKTG
jgi:alkylation response protein AidB-like acyl-CoA dehydrogenase